MAPQHRKRPQNQVTGTLTDSMAPNFSSSMWGIPHLAAMAVAYLCGISSGGIKLREYIAILGARSIGSQSGRPDIIGMRGS